MSALALSPCAGWGAGSGAWAAGGATLAWGELALSAESPDSSGTVVLLEPAGSGAAGCTGSRCFACTTSLLFADKLFSQPRSRSRRFDILKLAFLLHTVGFGKFDALNPMSCHIPPRSPPAKSEWKNLTGLASIFEHAGRQLASAAISLCCQFLRFVPDFHSSTVPAGLLSRCVPRSNASKLGKRCCFVENSTCTWLLWIIIGACPRSKWRRCACAPGSTTCPLHPSKNLQRSRSTDHTS